MTNIKLIAIDLDGTLLDDQKALPEENITAIKAAVAAGIKVVLCTGRPLPGTRPVFEQLGLSEEEYVIVNNGCSTFRSSDWQLVDDYRLTKEELVYLADISQQAPDIQLTVFDEHDHYYVVDEEPSDLVSYDAGLVFLEPTRIALADLLKQDVIYFEAMYVGEETALNRFEATYGKELSQHFSTVRSQSYIYETLPMGATKASALKNLVEQLGLVPEEVMALGDANNDIEMLTYAGTSVAMGNSPDHIKALAQHVTGKNSEAGVAQAIYEYALKNK